MHLTAKDRLIAALAAQLRAERETRDALAFVIANGQLDTDVLTAILTDPVPVFTQDDLNRADALSRQAPSGKDLSGKDLSGKDLSRQNRSRKDAPRRGGKASRREAA
ncbi:hypothetical protein [Bosea sp. 685]|uniref:hypothetical protein n=1 Tax=Bosea sp. 685 TaxID=3080057 RepID=UPI002892E084|nr:hypothetical protein [Bosea sp. 685]WNJ94136.1 hypothetical protein RMR04_10315 [Bosea sp. 685]